MNSDYSSKETENSEQLLFPILTVSQTYVAFSSGKASDEWVNFADTYATDMLMIKDNNSPNKGTHVRNGTFLTYQI